MTGVQTCALPISFGNTNHQFKDKMSQDLENTILMLKDYAKQVESKFGHLNILFTPSFFGDKIDVKFKDYKPENQPNLKSNDKSGLGMDSSTKIQDAIKETIYDSDWEDEFLADEEY